MEPYQQRVVEEKVELDTKIEKLTTFLTTNNGMKLSETDMTLLKLQLDAMEVYQSILGMRLVQFNSTKEGEE